MSVKMAKKKQTKKRANVKDDLKIIDGIKSNTVVKFTTALVPAPFTMLQNNTNLKIPPANWLSNSVSMYGVPNKIIHKSGFSSFTMAYKFPDCVGQVDVVSDAENVKKLLKMAYCPDAISLTVHRMGKTLLIDEFDVNKSLLASDGRWDLFHKLFQSMKVKPENVVEFKNSRTALQTKSLISKFLYHSLAQPSETTPVTPKQDPFVPVPLESDPTLPEPNLEEELPDPASSHTFARNVVWTFEDIQMLLGTDIPIFGGGTHPCISLRLRDMAKPINVLTGMDYWLDNLMCNVPEVIMCYHLNGIVQRYELIKTEDLPHLPNSKFSPQVVRDIAQNILSFLKSNATKAGHTYWLFKGRGDEVVKLYDLTSLCGNILDEGQTPFTVPVAMLLYRVARNLRNQDGRRQAPTIATLLKNCLTLLPTDKFPEIATSAHYMLADVYIPSDLDPRNPDLNPEIPPDSESEPQPDENVTCISTSLTAIQEPQDEAPETPPPTPAPADLSTEIDGRCFDCLKHVINGLQLLAKMSEFEVKMRNPSEPIPMPCGSPEKRPEQPSAEKASPVAIPQKSPVKELPVSWPEHLKALLLEKAALAYFTLLEYSYRNDQFGFALRYVALALSLLNTRILKKAQRPIQRWHGFLYGRAGDVLMTIVTNSNEMASHKAGFHNYSDTDRTLSDLLRQDDLEQEMLIPPTIESIESLLLASVACYGRALAVDKNKEQRLDYYRRLGNVENELGVFYMNKASNVLPHCSSDDLIKIHNLLSASEAHLEAGVSAFSHVNDSPNLALLYSNTGRFMRIRAHLRTMADLDPVEVSKHEAYFYNKAISFYLKAIDVLGSRTSNPNIWDSVYWELSTTYYSIACLHQDYPVASKSLDESEREATEALHKSLKFCDLETAGATLPIYQFRAAKIHHRLASLHHSQYRRLNDDAKKKQILQLSKLHYEKAVRLLIGLENVTEALAIQMERIGLDELVAECTAGVGAKVKHLTHALELMVEILPLLQRLKTDHKTEEKTDVDGDEKEERKEQANVISLLIQRLQHILLLMVKLSAKKGSSTETLKQIYGAALRVIKPNESDVSAMANGIVPVLQQLSNFLKKKP